MPYSVGSVAIYDTFANLPSSGVLGEIFFAQDTNLYYTWNGSAYVSVPVVGAPRVASIASSATPSINASTTDIFEITALAAAITGVTVTGTPSDGQVLTVRIKDNATPRAITWGASFVAGGVALLTTTAASKTHLNNFRYDSAAAKWACTLTDATGY